LSQFGEEDLKLLLGISVELSVSDFGDLDVSSQGDSKSVIFVDLVDVFQDFHDLWHDDDSLDDLLEDLRNFDNLLDRGEDWNFSSGE